jgi:haloalkane dehalogenase
MEWSAKRFATVLGHRMAYRDTGRGDPVVLLHGNPTSSYLWRRVIPQLTGLGRCIAPDLIGMGDSQKLEGTGDERYSFDTHRQHLDALLEQLGIGDDVTLVVHDWGSALGFDWARRHPGRVRGIAYMEALVRPLSWEEWPETAASIFRGFRSTEGERLVLENNAFVERVLPSSVLRPLEPDEMAEYRRPYDRPGEDRRPTLAWPRQLPIAGEPADVVEIVQAYSDWLETAEVPKLFVNADPGAILVGAQREFCRGWPNQTEVTVPGAHFVQEDSGEQIGQAIALWLSEVVAPSTRGG